MLRTGLLTFNSRVLEYVVTHEIGHTIGLRHTDWKTRSSCGGPNVNEGRLGAVRIPNTADQTTTSVMASCFDGNEAGKFRGEDVEAQRKTYSRGPMMAAGTPVPRAAPRAARPPSG